MTDEHPTRWSPNPDATATITDALKQLRAGLARLEQHEQTPRPLRFLAMHNLAQAEQILAEHLHDDQRADELVRGDAF